MRIAEFKRETEETRIDIRLNLDGSGKYQINTGIPFLNHMLELWTKHGLFDLEIKACGDLAIDDHHTVEDTGICLGKAIREALGNKEGVTRFGHALVPMDEALTLVAVDLSGRGYLAYSVEIISRQVGGFDTELVEEFMRAMAINGEFTLHTLLLTGKNTHHIIESIFKGLGRALREAVKVDLNIKGVPSTKGVL